MKGMQIMQMQEQTLASSEQEFEVIPREKAIEVFKVKLRIQLDQMDEMMEEQKKMMAQGGMGGPEAQMKMMMKMQVNKMKGSDELFEECGVDDDQLNLCIQKLNLERDPEFLKIAQENMAVVMQKAQAANPGAPGMGGMF